MTLARSRLPKPCRTKQQTSSDSPVSLAALGTDAPSAAADGGQTAGSGPGWHLSLATAFWRWEASSHLGDDRCA